MTGDSNHGRKPVRTEDKHDWVRLEFVRKYILVLREPSRGKRVCSAAPQQARRPVGESGADVKARTPMGDCPLPDALRRNVRMVHEDVLKGRSVAVAKQTMRDAACNFKRLERDWFVSLFQHRSVLPRLRLGSKANLGSRNESNGSSASTRGLCERWNDECWMLFGGRREVGAANGVNDDATLEGEIDLIADVIPTTTALGSAGKQLQKCEFLRRRQCASALTSRRPPSALCPATNSWPPSPARPVSKPRTRDQILPRSSSKVSAR